MESLEVRALTKSYPATTDLLKLLRRPWAERKQVPALRGLDLDLTAGRIYGVVGPNGAGKTTLLKILAGLVLPSSGALRIDGSPVTPRAVRETVGFVVTDERSFHWRLTLRQNLSFFATLQRLEDREEVVERCLLRVGLGERADLPYRSLSTGMRQRLAIARGLLTDPPVLLLDEATRSLDPASTRRLHDWVRAEFGPGSRRLLLYSTHDLGEVEELCTHLIVIRGGLVVAERDLAREGPLEVVSYELRTRSPVPEGLLDGAPGVVRLEVRGAVVHLRVSDPAAVDGVVDRLREAGIGLLALKPMPAWVDDLFAEGGS